MNAIGFLAKLFGEKKLVKIIDRSEDKNLESRYGEQPNEFLSFLGKISRYGGDYLDEIVMENPFLLDVEGHAKGAHLEEARKLLKSLPDPDYYVTPQNRMFNARSLKLLTLYNWAILVYYQNISHIPREVYDQILVDIIFELQFVDDGSFNAEAQRLVFTSGIIESEMEAKPYLGLIAHEEGHRFLNSFLSWNTVINEMAGDIAGLRTVAEIKGKQKASDYLSIISDLSLGRDFLSSGSEKVIAEGHYFARWQLYEFIDAFDGDVDEAKLFDAVKEINDERATGLLPKVVEEELTKNKNYENSVYFVKYLFLKYLQ